MAIREILLHPDQRLKKICNPIQEITDFERTLINDMFETMYNATGIGLAAPQVGVLKRIFVMDCSDKDTSSEPIVLINPEILWASDETIFYEEGCLSIPEFFGEIKRASRVKVQSLDISGALKEHEFEGISSICAQHEIDHLDGRLFIDYLGPIKRNIITTKMKKIKKLNSRKVIKSD